MERKQKLLIFLLKFAGLAEIYFAFNFLRMGYYLPEWYGLEPGLPLFYQMCGVELGIFGFLLWYSARDIERYLVIIIASCVFRLIMPLWPELNLMITHWPNQFAVIMIPSMIYDIGSAVLTLVLLKQLGYLKPKSRA